MMKQIQALLYFFAVDSRRTVTVFCSILLFCIMVLSVLGVAVADFMYIAITAPAYIFMVIFGFRTIQESLPFAIKRGVTRKSYHIAVGIFILLINFVMIAFLAGVQLLLNAVFQAANITNIRIIRPIGASTELKSILYSLPLDYAILLSAFAAGLLFGIIAYKFGFLGGAILGGIALIGITVSLTSPERLIDLITWMQDLAVLPAFGLVCAIAIVSYVISWIFIRTSISQPTA
ncbi:hypothetical protein CHH69_06425 [Terribacillus saccharophilus]|uniref:ABC-2 family transporter protein n=2 Tax=Terribacillus saccharophilus TaxID=361277 RepID=A0A268AAV0_9BACI|nr:hypothetical protein [Terribacillus saccharophilus]PAD21245.1 hypothetical protein CHH64_09950 [Terribacillus saccharophilus]PAF21098.1 hypothetical protein CHH49_13730 [Terribacillus saccharophilus]PAF39775.1 hypothetical protein CHH69_06425 [Terribacillus saccharophilus]